MIRHFDSEFIIVDFENRVRYSVPLEEFQFDPHNREYLKKQYNQVEYEKRAKELMKIERSNRDKFIAPFSSTYFRRINEFSERDRIIQVGENTIYLIRGFMSPQSKPIIPQEQSEQRARVFKFNLKGELQFFDHNLSNIPNHPEFS